MNVSRTVSLLLVALTFFLVVMVGNRLFSSVRVDLTEGQVYTLSKGTETIVSSLDEPIDIYFFFSQGASRDLTGLRAYAQRVEDLLREYEILAQGKIRLHVIDPEPFSEREDQAAEFGLQGVPVNTAGETLYFGVAGTNAVDDHQVIPFLQPDKEAFLEYELSKLVQTLSMTDKPVIGLLSSLPVQGDVNMQTFQTTPAWVSIDQLGQLFTLENLSSDLTEIPDHINMVMLVHPKNLSEEALYALDQFALSGGRILAFLDPQADQERSSNPMQPAMPSSSDLEPLLSHWGVTLLDGKVLGDSKLALSVSTASGMPARHLAMIGMQPENFSADDITVSGLESMTFASAGILKPVEGRTTSVTTLISSSDFAAPIESVRLQMLSDPTELQRDFSPTGERYPLAVRIQGEATSAFPDRSDEANHVGSTQDLNVVVVADSDVLADDMWVQVQNFFGQQIVSPWANNGDFLVNLADNLIGSPELISIRGRAPFSRPFDVVQDLRRRAEARYMDSANDLQARLSETEQKLVELESGSSQGLMALSAEQQAAIEQFQDEKLRIRKQLREVRHQLDQEIEGLGSMLKFVNILLMPLLLCLSMFLFNFLREQDRFKS